MTAMPAATDLTPRGSGVATPDLLSVAQVRWLGVLLVSVLVPQFPYVPVWIAGFGAALVALRFLLLHGDQGRADARPARIPSWALAVLAIAAGLLIRRSFGYFLGREPCVAFLFVLVGVKFLEARSARDGTLLVCLASFLVLTPFFTSQSLLAAAAAVPALLVLGATLQVLAQPSMRHAPLSAWTAPARLTLLLFLQGIPLAAMLFVVFPRIAGPLWGVPLDTAARSGLSDRMAPGMISQLSLSDAVAFRVDFETPNPPRAQRYWRGPVLSRFDGREWTMIDRQPGVAPRLAVGKRVIYSVTLEPHWKLWLFALDLPADLPTADSDADGVTRANEIAVMTSDRRLIARTPVSQPLRYRQTSVLGAAYAAGGARQLEADIADNLQLPPGRQRSNPRTLAFARELREQHPDAADYIDSVLQWFRSEPFYYTLEPPLLRGRDPVDDFLFDSRIGFCEHYASAFVVLLRAAGIPARVVTGYQGGETNPNGGYMIVRQSDAHAWAEALIDGQWHRYDPTGAVSPSRIANGLGGALPASEFVPLLARLDEGWFKGMQLAWDAMNHDWRRRVIGFNREQQRSLWRDWNIDALPPALITTVAALLIGLWGAGMLALLAWWRRRHGDRALVLWNALCARLAKAGLPRQPHEGPLEYTARAAARWPEFVVAFGVIGDSYAALRYGPAIASGGPGRNQAPALRRLAHAVNMLPAPSDLRAAPVSN